jgi:hypothetical protein
VGAKNLIWRPDRGRCTRKNVGTCRATYVPHSVAPAVRPDPDGELEILVSNPIGVFGTHTLVTYQPGSRFWPFQWAEIGDFPAAALALCGPVGVTGDLPEPHPLGHRITRQNDGRRDPDSSTERHIGSARKVESPVTSNLTFGCPLPQSRTVDRSGSPRSWCLSLRTFGRRSLGIFREVSATPPADSHRCGGLSVCR